MIRQKYGAKPCQVGAEKYRSGLERDRHQELLMMQRAGQIADLRREVPFELAPGVLIEGEKRKRPAVRYVADFCWLDLTNNTVVVADAKGMPTPMWRLKKHLMATIRGIHVREL